jgi:hypothetical protein
VPPGASPALPVRHQFSQCAWQPAPVLGYTMLLHVTTQQALRPLVPDVAITPACLQLGLGGFPPHSGFSCFCLLMSIHVAVHATAQQAPRPLAPNVSITSSLLAAWLGAFFQFSLVFPSFFWVAVAPKALCSTLDSVLGTIYVICHHFHLPAIVQALLDPCTLHSLGAQLHLPSMTNPSCVPPMEPSSSSYVDPS